MTVLCEVYSCFSQLYPAQLSGCCVNTNHPGKMGTSEEKGASASQINTIPCLQKA